MLLPNIGDTGKEKGIYREYIGIMYGLYRDYLRAASCVVPTTCTGPKLLEAFIMGTPGPSLN